jgi:acyl transferase domain-containing protein
MLNLKGPSVNISTACSTSLVVHFARQALGLPVRHCAGGRHPGSTDDGHPYQQGECFPDGHCRAFDARARGTVSATVLASWC